jgi:hypothetical protein
MLQPLSYFLAKLGIALLSPGISSDPRHNTESATTNFVFISDVSPFIG